MKFDDLDKEMRVYETAHDHCVLPGINMIARLDGRGFTHLTKEVMQFDAPFDQKFRDAMVETCKHLMKCGFRITYAYTQSDEISLVFHQSEDLFGRKTRKFNSVLAGEASAKLTQILGNLCVFDCRIGQYPNLEKVVTYLRWRHEDARRNALNAYCYWTLREQGETAQAATKELLGLSVASKNEFLFQRRGLNFNEVPMWQRRGLGIYWQKYEKTALNPKTNKETIAFRRRLFVDLELAKGDVYSEFVQSILESEFMS